MNNSLFEIKVPGQDNTNKKAILTGNSIKIIDPEIIKKINSTKLSPSMVASMLSSPGDWVVGKFIEPDVTLDSLIFLERGSWFHSIMEEFFKLPVEERTRPALKQTIQKVSKSKYPHLIEEQENRDWIIKAVSNYDKAFFDEDSKEKVAEIFLNGKLQQGIELFIMGKIGDAKRNCLGFIDRLTEGETGLKVHDWKTGTHIDNFDPNKKISNSNSFNYWRQQAFYSLLLQQKGINVEEAALIFPCSNPPQKILIPIQDERIIQQTIKDVEKCDKILDSCIENDYTFPFGAGIWNGWATYLCGLGNARYPKINEDKLKSLIQFGE